MEQNGTIYSIDLTTKAINTAPFTSQLARYILGGFGFNTWYLYKNLSNNSSKSALSPENILVISPGLLTGTDAPASSRLHISARSPLSGFMGSSNVGGHIGTRLKSLNVSSVIIVGKAYALSYILINEKGVSIIECEYLKGQDTRKTEMELRKKHHGKLTDILSIGVAGERLVLYACIMHGEDHAAGRTGMGAVMGSKNLKAIVVEGVKNKEKRENFTIHLSDSDSNYCVNNHITTLDNLETEECKSNPSTTKANQSNQYNPSNSSTKAIIKEYIDSIRSSLPVYEDFSKLGSSAHILPLSEAGQLGTRNYREGCMKDVQAIDGRNLKHYVKKSTSCHRCPVHCKAEVKIEAGRHQGFTGGRPEYETIINMGSLCGLSDPEELIYLSNFANILGIDTISTGSVIAFAMDLYERGILNAEYTDDLTLSTGGIELTWGNAKAMERLMVQIAHQEGFGKILSQGVKRASEIIGRGSEKFALHAKGVEIYGGDPRGAQAMALTYAISLRGGDFTSVYPIPAFRYSAEQAEKDFGTSESINPFVTEGKAALIKKCLFVIAVIDSLGLCKVPALSIIGKFDLENESRLIRSITGVDLSSQELFLVGERIINMEKLFNIACGATIEHDNLPDIFKTEGLPEGAVKGKTVHGLSDMVQDLYALMGWDKNGVPTNSVLKRLKVTTQA